MTLAFIGYGQIIITVVVPTAIIFFIGFFIGRKSGYIKRVKEVEKQNSDTQK